jgi:hypothetical protein
MVPDRLVESIAEHRCVLFVGSGLSRHTHQLPVWNELVKDVSREFQPNLTDKEITRDVLPYKLEYLEWCKEHDQGLFNLVLKRILDTSSRGGPPSPIHRVIASLPWIAIVTINLDNLIEEAFNALNEPCIVVDTERRLAEVGVKAGTLILKMHGSFDKEDMVLTSSEYQTFDMERHAMQAMVISLFSQYPILIVGAGLQDPDFTKLYGVVYSSLRGFKQTCYYLSGPLPEFVKGVWQARKFEFLTTPHSELDAWFANLEIAVNKRHSDYRPIGRVNVFSKLQALYDLADTNDDVSDANDYASLNRRYTAGIHIPDYNIFTDAWDRTLYGPLRNCVGALLERDAKDVRFLYIGPGPHAPLFAASGGKYLDKVGELILVDIDRRALQMAAQDLTRGFKVNVKTCETDITCGAGAQLTTYLKSLLGRANSLVDVSNALSDLGALNKIMSQANANEPSDYLRRAFTKSSIASDVNLVYSEMVASFTGTAPVMAFDTAMRRKFSEETRVHPALFVKVLKELRELWQRYNDWVYEVQLSALSGVTADGGMIAVATDTRKEFKERTRGSILSFTQADLPQMDLSKIGLCEVRRQYLTWSDHTSNFPASVEGLDVDYFLAHSHPVHFVVYKKGRPVIAQC